MSGQDSVGFLERSLSLAARGGRATAPNPRVGAVVVAGGEIVGEGWHRRAGEEHAEVQAIQAAGSRARGATLFTSLEPCSHEGRTPPCTSAIVDAGVTRVHVALIDPDPRVRGRGVEALRQAAIEVDVAEGAVVAEAERVLEDYLVHRRGGRAFAVIKVAATLDGRIADRSRYAAWVTGESARAHGRALRDRYGALVVGVDTVLADDPQLLPPTDLAEGGSFLRVVLDRRLRTPPGARLLRHGSWSPVIIYAAPDAPDERRAALEGAGAEVVQLGLPGQPVSPREVLCDLARRDVLGAIVEGGGATHGHFLNARLVDKIHWYLAPAVLGDSRAIAAMRAGRRTLDDAWRFNIANVARLGDDVVLTLYPAGTGKACSPESSRPSARSRPRGSARTE
ncbi:MAG: bifunctional diaminohydroxyphosphoribosylaminopyrimidine deaminase/5-amino-6-(5-phosphoribosylamino)uracil reductase RibD [Acidobacteriota bacterium]|nr:bifunctional diaminohydroxyphosphoribosylaminopyrimidine deaminase/5-amino-6-(5-phosphoribosylamino)uracil reductase RibD [Acidobacteriota bacterium]